MIPAPRPITPNGGSILIAVDKIDGLFATTTKQAIAVVHDAAAAILARCEARRAIAHVLLHATGEQADRLVEILDRTVRGRS